jgi:hypothetical protein
VRIWDLPPECLCRQHLLGEHQELHALWTILTANKTAYRRHPETRRWEGKLAALYQRHEAQVAELERRGYRHHSPLDASLAGGEDVQAELVDPIERQIEALKLKGCACQV